MKSIALKFQAVFFFVVTVIACSVVISFSLPFISAFLIHEKVFPIHPETIHKVSLKFDTKNGAYTLANAHFDNETTILIEVDVANGSVHLENCTFGSIVVHNFELGRGEPHTHGSPTAIDYFWQRELKHEQPKEKDPRVHSQSGHILHFTVVNCSVEYGTKFTGDTYYIGGSYRFIRYNGGPIVFPRLHSSSFKHSPLMLVKNSTVKMRTLPAFKKEEHGYQVDQTVFGDIIRFCHYGYNSHIKYTDEEIERLHPPSIVLDGNRIIGGTVFVVSERSHPNYAQSVIVKNNMFLDGSTIAMNAEMNTTLHGRIEITGNRFYGKVDPIYTSEGIHVLVRYTDHLLIANNFMDWTFPLAGAQMSAAHSMQSQTGLRVDAGLAARVDVKNNVMIIRKAERAFQAGIQVEGGFHLEILNNEVFVNRSRRHVYSLSNWRLVQLTPHVSGIRILEDDMARDMEKRTAFRVQRHINVEGNVVHVRNNRRPMPPRSMWSSTTHHEKLDDARPKSVIQKERDKRRERLEKYHGVSNDKNAAVQHDGWIDLLRLGYNDPEHDIESINSGAIRAFEIHSKIPTHAIIHNNTFHVWSSYYSHDVECGHFQFEDENDRSWIDIIGNRFSVDSNSSSVGLLVYALTNATHTIVRENEVFCKMPSGDCVTMTSFSDHKVEKQYGGSPPVTDDRTGYRGITFRRNKIRYTSRHQHIAASPVNAVSLHGGLLSFDTSMYLQDNDIQARGIWAVIRSTIPRVVLENNVIKAHGHLGGGFYDFHDVKHLHIHHDQLVRAPLNEKIRESWQKESDDYMAVLAKVHHGVIPPERRHDPVYVAERKKLQEQHGDDARALYGAFMEAQKSHAKSLLLEHKYEEEDYQVNDMYHPKIVYDVKRVLKSAKKYSVSKLEANRPFPHISGSFVDPTASKSASKSKSVVNEQTNNNDNNNQVQSELEMLPVPEKYHHVRVGERSLSKTTRAITKTKEILLTPIFANNLTFPQPFSKHERTFSIQCLMMNGKPVSYEEVEGYIPHAEMNKWELALPHMKGIVEKDDTVNFGCPEEKGQAVAKVRGSASEDL